MRHVMISQNELNDIRDLYEGVMSNASHGLFFKEGSIIGIGIAHVAIQDKETYFETCRSLLIDKNWVEEIEFEEKRAWAKGSIESSPEHKEKVKTCHRLRGIIRKLYETYLNQKVYCKETECVSAGNDKCIFEIGTMEMWK